MNKSMQQVLHVPKLSRSDFESWLCTNPLQKLESLVIFKAPELTLDTIMWLLEELEAITELGDLHSMDFAKASGEVRKTLKNHNLYFFAGEETAPGGEEEGVGCHPG